MDGRQLHREGCSIVDNACTSRCVSEDEGCVEVVGEMVVHGDMYSNSRILAWSLATWAVRLWT